MDDHTYGKAKQRVENFFNCEIRKYILPDINRLTNEIKPRGNEELEGCTVPLAMMLFAIIDLFGYLTRDDPNPSKKQTFKNAEYLFSKYFPDVYSDNCGKIIKLFRHGLIHQFFPKATGISKAGSRYPLIFATDVLNLNVDILSADVVNALAKLRKEVFEELDKELILRINDRLDLLAKEDYEELANA